MPKFQKKSKAEPPRADVPSGVTAPDQRQPTSAQDFGERIGLRPWMHGTISSDWPNLAMDDDVEKKLSGLIVVGDPWFAMCCGFKLVAVLQEAVAKSPSRHEPVPG